MAAVVVEKVTCIITVFCNTYLVNVSYFPSTVKDLSEELVNSSIIWYPKTSITISRTKNNPSHKTSQGNHVNIDDRELETHAIHIDFKENRYVYFYKVDV